MAVSYRIDDGEIIGFTAVTSADTTAKTLVGTTLRGQDSTYGVGEFLYAKFTGTVAAGDFVMVDRFAQTCVQLPTAATKGNVGISMAAQVAGQFGWVMIRGVHDGANVVTGVVAGSLLGQSAVAGRANISGTVANGTVDGALAKNTAASNVGTVELYWPTVSGR